MNQDEFLTQFQERPRDEFRLSLKSRLIKKNSEEPVQLSVSLPLFWQQKRWALSAGIAFLLAVGLLFAPVNANQTLAQALYYWVAGLEFIEVESANRKTSARK